MFFLRQFGQYPSSLIFIHPPSVSYIDSKQRKQINSRELEKKMKKWSSQWTQFKQLRKEAWKKKKKKFRTSTGFEPVTSRLPVRCSTNWAMKPLWKKWVLMIYEINHIWTAEKKWKWRNDRRSDRSLRRSFLDFNSFQQFIYDLFHISLT